MYNISDNNVGSHGFFKTNAMDIRRLCEIRVIIQYLELKVEEQLHSTQATRSCTPISLVLWNLENFQNILGMIEVGLTCCKSEELTLSSFCMWLGKQNLRVWPLFLDDQLLLLSMVTQTSTETRHAMVVPFNLGVRSHVIVSGYILSVKITLPSSLKGNEAAAADMLPDIDLGKELGFW